MEGFARLKSRLSKQHAVESGKVISKSNRKKVKPQKCDRTGCENISKIFCSGCQYVRYCSESCRVQDIIDPRIQHLAACIPAEPLESSLAMKLEPRDHTLSSIRSIVQSHWEAVCPILNEAPEAVPPLKKFFFVSLDAKNFTKSVVYRAEKNTIIVFWPSPLYEVRFSMRESMKWLSVLRGNTYLGFDGGDLCFRPTKVTEFGSQNNGIVGPDGAIAIFMAFVLDYEMEFHTAVSQSVVNDPSKWMN